MKLSVGFELSRAKTATGMIRKHGKIMNEAQVAGEPKEMPRRMGDRKRIMAAVGLEAVPLSH